MVQLRSEMCAKARDLWGRRNGRLSIEADRVVFKEFIPMALKNKIKPGELEPRMRNQRWQDPHFVEPNPGPSFSD